MSITYYSKTMNIDTKHIHKVDKNDTIPVSPMTALVNRLKLKHGNRKRYQFFYPRHPTTKRKHLRKRRTVIIRKRSLNPLFSGPVMIIKRNFIHSPDWHSHRRQFHFLQDSITRKIINLKQLIRFHHFPLITAILCKTWLRLAILQQTFPAPVYPKTKWCYKMMT